MVSIAAMSLATGCASDRDLRQGESLFGGGQQVTPVTEQIYYVYIQTKASPVAMYETAKRMWLEQSQKACNGKTIKPLKVSQSLAPAQIDPLVVTEMAGYAVCSGVELSQDEIQAAIEQYEAAE